MLSFLRLWKYTHVISANLDLFSLCLRSEYADYGIYNFFGIEWSGGQREHSIPQLSQVKKVFDKALHESHLADYKLQIASGLRVNI